MLLRLVVVKDGIEVFFEREKVSAYFDEYSSFLIVNDLTKEENSKKIGVFNRWDYWHYVDE